MSTYEKIASALLAILVVLMIIFSYRELTEPKERPGTELGSSFDDSIGPNFQIGPFVTLVSHQASGGMEENCAPQQPVIIAALHDIDVRLHDLEPAAMAGSDAFEVNKLTLQELCNKNVEIILSNARGDTLLLQKVPFKRGVPPQGSPADVGTEVRINATITPAGSSTPQQPTIFGDLLIPDHFLDLATSTEQ